MVFVMKQTSMRRSRHNLGWYWDCGTVLGAHGISKKTREGYGVRAFITTHDTSVCIAMREDFCNMGEWTFAIAYQKSRCVVGILLSAV